MRVACVSDLHMFFRHSVWERYAEEIDAAAQRSEVVVFNGDCFEFKLSSLRSNAATLDAAVAWLRAFLTRHRHAETYVLLGNHDHRQVFCHGLETLCGEFPNLRWHPYYARLGPALFFHGDAAYIANVLQGLENRRERRVHHDRQADWKGFYIDPAYAVGVPAIASPLIYPAWPMLPVLLRYARTLGHSPENGLESIYFGHIHRLINARCGGVQFFNGGAAVAGAPFQILETML